MVVCSSIALCFLNPMSSLRCHNLLHAVKKSTREVRALVRERVTLVYGKGKRDEKYVIFQVYIE